jgi:hypothetical protein
VNQQHSCAFPKAEIENAILPDPFSEERMGEMEAKCQGYQEILRKSARMKNNQTGQGCCRSDGLPV